jgi:hypothetical protein
LVLDGEYAMFKQLAVTAVVAALALSATSARAGFIGFLTSTSTNTYNYTLRFTPETTTPPTFGQEKLVSGDLITFYDVLPAASNLVSAVVNGADAASFTVSHPLLGTTPANLVGAAGITDSATGVNVTFAYTGPTLILSAGTIKDFSATITTTAGFAGTHIGTGVGDSLVDFGGGFTGEKDTLYPVLLPQTGSGGPGTPEPATLSVLALGGVALLARRRRA